MSQNTLNKVTKWQCHLSISQLTISSYDQVEILGEDFKDRLLEYVEEDQLPIFLGSLLLFIQFYMWLLFILPSHLSQINIGGTDETEFGSSPEEEALKEHVDRVLLGEDPFEEENEEDELS